MLTTTYTEDTINSLYNAWANGLDYVESNGTMFACFSDGIWTIKNDTVHLTEEARIQFVLKPSKPWGYNAD